MNYARAAKGTLTHHGLLREVDCQSELELGRHLDPSEKALFFSRFPPDIVVHRIDKVCNLSKDFLIFKLFNLSSLAMVH